MYTFADISKLCGAKKKDFVHHSGGAIVGGNELESLLGSGRFSNVYKSGRTAIKVYRPGSVDRDYFENEVKILSTLISRGYKDSGFIGMHLHIGFNSEYKPRIYPCIFMEYMESTLSSYVSRSKHMKWKPIMRDILAGLKGIHSCGIIHCDIKPSNILVSYSSRPIKVRIGDFGTSCKENDPFDPRPGSPEYNAPEILMRAPYTRKADIWSVACVGFYLITKSRLFTVDGVSKFKYRDGYDNSGESECSRDSPQSSSSSFETDSNSSSESSSSENDDKRIVQSMYRLFGPFPANLVNRFSERFIDAKGIPHNYTEEPGKFDSLFESQYESVLGENFGFCRDFISMGLRYDENARPDAAKYMKLLCL